MSAKDIKDYRAARMLDLLTHKFSGNKAELGKALGYQSGAFVRQMIDGDRAITEKTIAKVEALPGCNDWFRPKHPSVNTQDIRASVREIASFVASLDGLDKRMATTAIQYLLDDPADHNRMSEVLEKLARIQAAG